MPFVLPWLLEINCTEIIKLLICYERLTNMRAKMTKIVAEIAK